MSSTSCRPRRNKADGQVNPQIGGNLSTAEEADQPPVCLRCRLVVRGAQSGRQDVISDRPRNAGPGSTPRAAPRPGRPPRALYGPPSRRTTGEPYGPTSGSLDAAPRRPATPRAEPSRRHGPRVQLEAGQGREMGPVDGALRSGRRPRAGERETRPRARSTARGTRPGPPDPPGPALAAATAPPPQPPTRQDDRRAPPRRRKAGAIRRRGGRTARGSLDNQTGRDPASPPTATTRHTHSRTATGKTGTS